MEYWIYTPHNDKHIAYQCLEGGYIPFRPYGGRHIMDDYGDLIEALPQRFHLPQYSFPAWKLLCYYKDMQYICH